MDTCYSQRPRGAGRDRRANETPGSPWPGPGRAPARDEPEVKWLTGAVRDPSRFLVQKTAPGAPVRMGSQATDSWQEGRVSSDMCSLKLASGTSWPGAQVSLSQPRLPTSLPPTGLEPWRYRDLSSAPGAREREATCLRHTGRVAVPGGAPQERQVSFNPKPTGSPETILAG